MKELTITAVLNVYKFEELTEADRTLLQAAMDATKRSYAPYSKFSVGAAARLNNDVIVTGTNQENAAYPSGLCAERTTLFYANVITSYSIHYTKLYECQCPYLPQRT